MSSAKRTPRYVEAIHPFEIVERGMSTEVIRLRPEPLGPSLPPITEHWPRAKAIPLARRPWQLLLVPPTPGAPTRGFNVARWQARLLLGLAAGVLLGAGPGGAAVGVVLIVAGAGVSAVVIALRSPDLFATSAEAAMLRARLTVVEDSLAVARSELEAPDDSLAAVMGGALVNATP